MTTIFVRFAQTNGGIGAPISGMNNLYSEAIGGGLISSDLLDDTGSPHFLLELKLWRSRMKALTRDFPLISFKALGKVGVRAKNSSCLALRRARHILLRSQVRMLTIATLVIPRRTQHLQMPFTTFSLTPTQDHT